MKYDGYMLSISHNLNWSMVLFGFKPGAEKHFAAKRSSLIFKPLDKLLKPLNRIELPLLNGEYAPVQLVKHLHVADE